MLMHVSIARIYISISLSRTTFIPPPPSLSRGSCLFAKEFGTTRRFHKIEVMTNGNETFPTCGVSLSYHHTIRFGHIVVPADVRVCPRVHAWHSDMSFLARILPLFGESTYVMLVYTDFVIPVDLSPRRRDRRRRRHDSLLAPEWAAATLKR